MLPLSPGKVATMPSGQSSRGSGAANSRISRVASVSPTYAIGIGSPSNNGAGTTLGSGPGVDATTLGTDSVGSTSGPPPAPCDAMGSAVADAATTSDANG